MNTLMPVFMHTIQQNLLCTHLLSSRIAVLPVDINHRQQSPEEIAEEIEQADDDEALVAITEKRQENLRVAKENIVKA